MVAFFDHLAVQIDKPKRVQFGDFYTYRYENPSINAAALQKLARVITGLQALHILNVYSDSVENREIS
jgi:hypothetical protein